MHVDFLLVPKVQGKTCKCPELTKSALFCVKVDKKSKVIFLVEIRRLLFITFVQVWYICASFNGRGWGERAM